MLRMTAMGCGLFACLLTALPAAAQDDEPAPPPVRPLFDQGRLLATGGVAQVEGAGGGGLAAWALIAGYGTDNGMGLRGHATTVVLPDYRLTTLGVSTGLFDRVELSYAWMEFDTLGVGAALGLGQGFTFHQHVFGAKLRLFGDAIYDQDGWLPQVSVGLQHKQNDRGAVIAFIGGKSDTGTDYYLAASKLFLAESLLVNATVRATRANQLGILGFGGDKHSGYSAQFEGSVAYLADPRINMHFAESNIERIRAQFKDQFCQVAGGPCEYKGHSMAEAHKGLKLTNYDFAAVVEDLQMAMDKVGLPFAVQNRFLARLAPMRPDVVTK